MGWVKVAPLPGSILVTSLLGFTGTLILWDGGKIPDSFATAFCIVFVIMFLASCISTFRGNVDDELRLDEQEDVR